MQMLIMKVFSEVSASFHLINEVDSPSSVQARPGLAGVHSGHVTVAGATPMTTQKKRQKTHSLVPTPLLGVC